MTASATLLPLAAATAQLVTRSVADVVKQGVAFADLLRIDNPDQTADRDAGAAHAPGAPELTCDSRALHWKTACQAVTARTDALHQLLVDKLAGQGIDLAEPIVLRADTDGHILVANGHLDRADIELLIESDAQLAEQLRQLFQQLAALEGPSPGAAPPDIAAMRLVVSRTGAFFTVP